MSSISEIAKERLKKAVKKKKKKLKKYAMTAAVALIICAAAGGVLTALLSLITGFISMLFSPFTNKYQKDAVYDTIKSYGSAYEMLGEGLLKLEKNGVDYQVIDKVFKEEAASFDAYASTITAPVIEYDDFAEYCRNEHSQSADDGSNDVQLIWNMNDFTYQFRTHWQYILAMSTIMCFDDDDAIDKAMEDIGDDINDDGTVSGDHSLSSLVSSDKVDDALSMIYNKNTELKTEPFKSMNSTKKIDSGIDMSTSITYYTNYCSDSTYTNAQGEAGGNGLYGFDMSTSGLINSYDYTKYCHTAYSNTDAGYPAVDMDNFSSGNYDYDGNLNTADCYRYSTLNLTTTQGSRRDGNVDGDYAYITYNNEIYPVCLVKEASNWLCTYSDFDYVKIKVDEKNTKYACTTYKKTYNIANCVKQWESYGIDSSLYPFVFDIMSQLESVVGGTIAMEFSTAYDYYMQNGTDLVVTYTDPAYSPISRDGTESIDDNASYTKPIISKAASTKDMTDSLKEVWMRQNGSFKCSTKIGKEVATIMYGNNMCWQMGAQDSDYQTRGYYSAQWGENNYNPSHTPGGAATVYGFGSRIGDSSNGININEKIGLSSAGLISMLLRYSILKPQSCSVLSNYPTISELYNKSDYKFRDSEELRVGDLAFLSPTEDSDYSNIIAYYIGRDGRDYVFISISPNYNGGIIRKITLDSSDNASYEKANLTYFCRYYNGWDGDSTELIDEYSTNHVNAQLHQQYADIKTAYDAYIADGNDGDISYQDQFADYIELRYGYSYERDVLLHVSGGIMSGGVGDDRLTGIEFNDSMQDDLYGEGLTFPLHETYSITSWYGWRPDFSTAWHDGMDFGTPIGTNVYPLASGVVERATYEDSSGNYMVIDYGDGVKSYYLHLSEFLCQQGDSVTVGTPVAKTGDSGGIYQNGVWQGYPAHFHFKVVDGNTHTGTDMYGLGYMYGSRDGRRTDSIDPYLIFMSELEEWPNYTNEADGNRPKYDE